MTLPITPNLILVGDVVTIRFLSLAVIVAMFIFTLTAPRSEQKLRMHLESVKYSIIQKILE